MSKPLPEYLKALFLGPKAENAELIERLLLDSFRDHCSWRRDFHPEDVELVSAADQGHADFLAAEANLRRHLQGLLAQLKEGTPNYHPRYLGHMHSDLATAGIVGEFATIFYFQNNVAAEGGPVTSRLEVEAIRQVAEMVGYRTSGSPSAWGHLCSGGTVANLEALWAARNLRHMPVSLFLNIRRAQRLSRKGQRSRRLGEALGAFSVSFRGRQRRFVSLKTHELLNLPVDLVLGLRDRLAQLIEELLRLENGAAAPAEAVSRRAHREADELLRNLSPEKIGTTEVNRLLVEAGQAPLGDYPWTVYLSTTAHYSFDKIADLLGLGRGALRHIPIGRDFGLDVVALQKEIETKVLLPLDGEEPCPLPLAVIAVMGSTEEGSLDDLPGLLSVRDYLRANGIEFWVHSDAAYGGYAASMLRRPHPALKSPLSAEEFFTSLAGEDMAGDELVRVWERSFKRLQALSQTDSITIDPHKMGYLPYPAGVALFRDSRSRLALSCEVPYLSDHGAAEAFPGRFTLEGSRPGHVAAGVYLAHKVLPLDQTGHGILIGRSLLGAREIYLRVRQEVERLGGKIHLRFVCPPALNILTFVLCHDDIRSLEEQNLLTRLISEEFSAARLLERPPSDFELFVEGTELSLRHYGHVLRRWLSAAKLEVAPEQWEKGSLSVFRSVIMHPHLLGARTRKGGSERGLVEEIARLFAETCHRKVAELNNMAVGPIEKGPLQVSGMAGSGWRRG